MDLKIGPCFHPLQVLAPHGRFTRADNPAAGHQLDGFFRRQRRRRDRAGTGGSPRARAGGSSRAGASGSPRAGAGGPSRAGGSAHCADRACLSRSAC